MRLTKNTFEHPEWGTIAITRNPRARRIILRLRSDGIHITIPPFATKNDIERALAECAPKLLAHRPQHGQTIIDRNYSCYSDNFTFSIGEHDKRLFQLRSKGKENLLLCPTGTDYSSSKMQEWLRQVLKKAIAKAAKRTLPARLNALALQHGLEYNRCQVRDTHTRWGSCSSHGNISLSIYLILLPDRLIDYVLRHELCHTIHMNHGEGFWQQLDRLCQTDSKALRKELKNYRTGI